MKLDLKAIRATIPHPDSLDGVRLGGFGDDMRTLCDRVEVLERALRDIKKAEHGASPLILSIVAEALEEE